MGDFNKKESESLDFTGLKIPRDYYNLRRKRGMLQMNQHYEPEFKKKIVRLHLEEGRSLKGLAAEYGVSKASISNWTKQFREECQKNEEAQADYDFMKENLKLKRQLAELQKENDFLKKAAAFFAKEID